MIQIRKTIKTFLSQNNIANKIKFILEEDRHDQIERMRIVLQVRAKLTEKKAIIIACYIAKHKKDFILSNDNFLNITKELLDY